MKKKIPYFATRVDNFISIIKMIYIQLNLDTRNWKKIGEILKNMQVVQLAYFLCLNGMKISMSQKELVSDENGEY